MKKEIASVGLVLVLVAAVLFYIVFSGGKLVGFTITGSNATANFIAFFYVITALPIGAGLTYFGFAFRPPMYAAGGQPPIVYKVSSGVAGAALAVAIIGLIVAFAAIGVSLSGVGASPSGVSTISSEVASLNSKVSSLNSEVSNVASVNVAPSPQAIKVDWCNTDNTGQDRYCPSTIVVNQGDVVQLLFMHNDTDAHTFTLDTAPYFFQINASSAGMHNFLTDQFNAGDCSNSGSITQQQAAISGTYCVSGSSLLSSAALKSNGATSFAVAQNPVPTNPLTGGPIELTVDNQVHFDNTSSAAVSAGTIEVWGIGAFQATTPGVFEFFCHYHVSNGMFGYLVVLPNAYCTSNPSACGVTSTTSA